MRFGVLGPLAVHTSRGEPVTVTRTTVRTLLARLLANDGEPVSAGRLIEDLWGAAPPRDPAAALQVRVAQLRKALADAEPDARTLVVSTPAGYLLRTSTVDAAEFTTLTARASNTTDLRSRVALLDEALALWRGPAYADVADEPFARAVIMRLTEQRLVAIEDRAEALLALGERDVQLTELVDRHPLRERLRAIHLRALYRVGQQGEALASFEDIRERLRESLGVDPGPELAEVHQLILRQDSKLAAPAPRRTNLPAEVSDLIGRTAAIDEVGTLIKANRLVTLTGSGGVGKTRLALATARRQPGTVWLVELAGVTDIAEAVLTELGIREHPSPHLTPAELLVAALRDKELLLVLDNCEHVVAAAAELVSRLLRAAPSVRVLVTSQEPLGLPGETRYPVPPLDLPAAAQLLEARIAALAPDFRLADTDAPAVAELCRRLDGIPLALELAAARIPVLGVAELVARLDDRFRLLTGGYRDAPPRQRTLRAVLDWSWGLLAEPEQVVLRRLSVHVDGCALDAAGYVSDVDSDFDTVDALSTLAERSLVVVEPGPRFRLLESVVRYGLERLADAGETAEVRRRHQTWYLELAERARDQLYGPGQRHWLATLDRESANLRAALDGLVHDGHADPALRLANALTGYWFLRGRRTEAIRALAAALELGGSAVHRAQSVVWQLGLRVLGGETGDQVAACRAALRAYEATGDTADVARARWFLGYALYVAGELTVSEELINQALAEFSANGDTWGEAVALGILADQALLRGDLSTVESFGERSAALLAELGDRWGQSQVASPLAALAEISGDYEKAAEVHQEGLRLAEELGLWTDVAERLSGLGRLRLLAGDYPAAWELHSRAMRLAAEHSYEPGVVHAKLGLALGARRTGELAAAEAYLREVLDWHRSADFAPGNAFVLTELGFVAEQRGEVAAAEALHREGLAEAEQVGDPRAVALALEGLAGAAAAGGDGVRAARLLGAAAAARDAAGAPLPAAERSDVDRITAAARQLVGTAAVDAELARGGAGFPDAPTEFLSDARY